MMVYKDAQHQSLHKLLSDTVSMLCRSGLAYQLDMKIEGLIGVTIDSKEVYLFNLQDVLSNSDQADDEDHFCYDQSDSRSCNEQIEDALIERDLDNNADNASHIPIIIPKKKLPPKRDKQYINSYSLSDSPTKTHNHLAINKTNSLLTSESQDTTVKLEVVEEREGISAGVPMDIRALEDSSLQQMGEIIKEEDDVSNQQNCGVNNAINNNDNNENIDNYGEEKLGFMQDAISFNQNNDIVHFENNQASLSYTSSTLHTYQHNQLTFTNTPLSQPASSHQSSQPYLQRSPPSHHSQPPPLLPTSNLSHHQTPPHRSHHPTLQQLTFYKSHPIICPLCGKRFPRRLFLMAHLSTQHGLPKPFSCLVCGKGYAYKQQLKKHRDVHHS